MTFALIPYVEILLPRLQPYPPSRRLLWACLQICQSLWHLEVCFAATRLEKDTNAIHSGVERILYLYSRWFSWYWAGQLPVGTDCRLRGGFRLRGTVASWNAPMAC